jgi:hypothetical protein
MQDTRGFVPGKPAHLFAILTAVILCLSVDTMHPNAACAADATGESSRECHP